MASMRARLEKIKRDPRALIDPGCVARACRASGHEWRERTLGPLATLEAFAVQVAHGNTALGHVARLMGGRFTESAYCQARSRLPVAVVRTLLREFTAGSGETPDDWRGHRVVLIDGTGVSLPDTPELRAHFGTAGDPAPGCGLPCAKVLCVFRAHDGMLLDLHLATACAGDLGHVREVHPALRPGDVLVGDRGLCAYTHLADLLRIGCHGLFRMQACRVMPFPASPGPRRRLAYNRHRSAEPVLVELITRDDQVVEIVKPHNRPKSMAPGAFARIPSTLVVRAVRYRVAERGFRAHEFTLLTTLTDASRYSAEDLARLYLMRWRVEINLRHLKRTLGMDRLKCGSVAGVTREVLMLALLYNAVCRVRALAAAAANTDPTRLSFIDALRALHAAIRGSRVLLPRPTKLKSWPLRTPRPFQRRVKRKHSDYRVLTMPRHRFVEWLYNRPRVLN